ncbi:MAG: heparinase II/III family protein, partial [Candidatus Ornithomonoglobus sp.]
KNAIENDEELQSVYNSMKTSADGTSLEQYKEQLPFLGKENYDAMGLAAEDGMFDEKGGVSVEYVKEHFKYTASSNVQASAPDNAVTAKVELNLPAGEWEGAGDGQGHVWFDNISGYGTTSSFDIKNPSFETGKNSPDNWTFVKNGSGNSEFKWENASNLVSAGAKSAYIQNNDAEADSSLISDAVAVNAGEQYTVTMDARLDRVLIGNNKLPRYNDSGVRLILHWYDAEGNEISSSSVWHNKRAGTGPRCNQTDAIVYFVTGETEYAEKAKYGILLKLNDIAQGAEEWIMTNSRPNGIDAYGGVQIGRNLCVLSQMYSLIKGSGVFSEYEKELMTSLFEENIRFMADYRDRSELMPEDFSDVGNWATDTWAGTAMTAMAMPEYKQSRQLLDNALYLLSGQINTAIGENGTYPESTRYMWAGINRFSLYAYCNSAYEGLDCFGNTYLGRLYRYALDIQTPYYSYLGYSSSPPFGDNTLSKGNFGLAYAYLDQIYRLDPDLAQALYKTWCDAGRPRVSYSSEDVGMPALFTPTQFEEDTEYKLSLTSNNDYPESMGPIFRDNFGQQGKEMYVAINAPSKTMQHMHDDTGQIIFYANSEPLIMDPGVESYFDATTLGWFKGSASHSVLQFYGSGDWNKCPNPGDSDKPSEVKEFVTNDNIDFASISIQHSAGTQVRHAAYLRGGVNALVVWDDVTSTVKARTNWGTQAESVSIDGNKFVSSGHFNMDLETTVLPAEDSTRQMSTKWGRMTAAWPNITVDGVEDTYINMEYIEQDAGKDFFAVHYPKE